MIRFLNTINGKNKVNIFIQNDEPTAKNGIWIKTSNLSYTNIVEVEDKSSLVANSINIVKGTQYETIVIDSDIVNGLHYKFDSVYITDSSNNIDYEKNIYYGNDSSWIDITPQINAIYGIKRAIDSSSSQWTRTDDAVGLIANATKNGNAVQNNFDNLSPWKDIISYNYDTATQQATAYYGDDNFTFTPTENNILVLTKIPTFWYKREQKADGYEYIQIANYEAEGFDKFNSCSVGRYTVSGSTESLTVKSGISPLMDEGLVSFKSAIENIGTNFYMMDWQTWGAIQLLYLVEYADYDSQEMLGNGIIDGFNALAVGGCDSLGMKSGCLVNDNKHSVIYRGIENVLGNAGQCLDGINFNGVQGYVCKIPDKYVDSKFDEDYEQLSYVCAVASKGDISKIGYDVNNPLAMFPIETTSNIIKDKFTSSSTNQYYGIAVGGNYWDGGGLWFANSTYRRGYEASRCSARVLKIDNN